jgi:hypothetical protein
MSDPARVERTRVLREAVEQRVHRFAVVRAAQRALAPSYAGPQADQEALRSIRQRLAGLLKPFENVTALTDIERREIEEELLEVDRALDGYTRLIHGKIESIPLAQLRASLSVETRALRSEVMALLEVSLEAPATSARFLHVVDLLLTLLCTSRRGDVWVFDTDPVNVHQAVRRRCDATPPCGSTVEASIVSRFQEAADRLARGDETVIPEMSAYKAEIAEFHFVPAVLRCIVGYNAVARNHVAERLERSRELDSRIDEEMGLERPLAGYEERDAAHFLPAHESPGVLAVQEAIGNRITGQDTAAGPAQRIASQLDLDWLDPADRQAFLEPRNKALRLIRMTVVLGHLAVCLESCQADVQALGLHADQLDAWICDLGKEIQAEINTRIRSDIQGAVHLGDVKSRFLTAVLLVARRRREPGRRSGGEEVDTFQRDAIAIVREYLESQQFRKPPPMFLDLLGGGWRRTVALSAVGLMVLSIGVVQLMPAGPRATRDLSERALRNLSPYLTGGYRDYAKNGSIFVARTNEKFDGLGPYERRAAIEKALQRLLGQGVAEMMIFDDDGVLQAHYKSGAWRSERAWRP